MPRTISDKWLKTGVLLKHKGIAGCIPETQRYSEHRLRHMLDRYGSVVAKPATGTGGRGLMLLRKHRGGYSCHYYGRIKRVGSFRELARRVDRIRRHRSYLLQQAIQLASIGGRPVDYRVKTIRRSGRWRIRAIVGRLARPGLFVTNLCRGGLQLRANKAIRRSLSVNPARKIREMQRLTYQSASLLSRAFPGLDQLGFDYGLDTRGRVWMFEVNTKPK
ncbi:YheC/YheD family protein [Paenibacillus filicis]|uniref:YheC/YheD family protein n=1 Tax=Paenibacillus gyeongsangnamensis TaxID=3388067 RepID=A0ABT4QFT7_9BACL|nr:YheC/YheD family protein [Paenibacillus filicis]MCZ8515745.1 YheC/YheD family protein [Paenibacillus filicis]